MAKIKITCDSAADLPQDLVSRYRIDALPLPIRMGGELRRDRVDVDADEAFAYTSQTGQLPAIAAVPDSLYREAFLRYLEEGYEVIHVSLSSGVSHCYQNAVDAVKGLSGVHIVDSCSVSTGVGQLAVLAAELAGAEYRPKEIVDALNEMKQKLEVSFLVQAPEYLRKGCKMGGLAAFGDKLLKLKPEIVLRRGMIHRGTPLHGDQEQSILSYVDRALRGRKNIQTDRIFITYSQVPQATLDKVKALLKQLQPFEEILEAPASSVVSGRWGPGCLGLSYLTC